MTFFSINDFVTLKVSFFTFLENMTQYLGPLNAKLTTLS